MSFVCASWDFFLKFMWNKRFWNNSLLDPLFEVQKWLIVEVLGQSCEKHCETIYNLNCCISIFFPRVVFCLHKDYSGPCQNGGFGFGDQICFVWNVWCFKPSIKWRWDQLHHYLCHFVVYDTLSMARITVFQYQEFLDVQIQYLLVTSQRCPAHQVPRRSLDAYCVWSFCWTKCFAEKSVSHSMDILTCHY